MINIYYGYENYFTWAAVLWIGNEEYSHRYFRELAQNIKAEINEETEQTYTMAKHVKDFIEENAPEMESSLYSDLLNCAIEHIDFYGIAENILVDD